MSDVTHEGSRRIAQKHLAPSAWEAAEQGRDALEAVPEGDRTHAQYTHAMDAYRAIYHSHPADLHAAAAVNAVAELLAEQGRIFHDDKLLKAAIGQYEFLRKQYPGSSLRVQALLTEGEIEQNDLTDASAARGYYQLLLKDYPRSEQAEEARAGVASLEQESGQRVSKSAGQQVSRPAGLQASDSASQRVSEPARSTERPAATLPAAPATSEAAPEPEFQDVDAQTRPTLSAAADVHRSGQRGSGRALVTGVRHWSTPTYTRVAIDLGDSVTYEAARVPHPDRIYFDLHGSRLAPALVGKSFNVTDDGFLKRVRAAQYSNDVTRVVLDVSDVSEYSAFLLPNPYRLIIDIHGGRQTAAQESAKRRDVPAPHTAAEVRSTASRPVPNTVATRNPDSANELADLSAIPGRVDATRRPTSKPIAAVVADGEVAGDRATDAEASTADSGSVSPVASPAAGGTPGAAAPAPMPSVASTRRTRRGRTTSTIANATPARAAAPMADGETSLVRALGLKIGRIVIDAGHGGHDSGTLGADGIEEKDVVLDVALRLGSLLHDRLGAEIIYTRSDDTFIPLETRTAIANKAQADLFISIHANSSPDASARGVEVYYLNFTSDPTALDVAARENAVSDQSIHQLSDLVKKITLKDKIAESREFASDVEGSLYAGLARGNAGLKDRGVKKAPFVVLIGANMPSILAEISFVTNPKDAAQLRDPDYRERVAESLYRGVAHYEAGLSGSRPVATERASVGN
ncbi:MAG TPA: N-acetylmuramoyl-L-alanine amidase [Acidobacteriaceae bacterium]|nr:N-acetylmuramoyl-L-alanine amidase [Acidobacteriaceae bacterium]